MLERQCHEQHFKRGRLSALETQEAMSTVAREEDPKNLGKGMNTNNAHRDVTRRLSRHSKHATHRPNSENKHARTTTCLDAPGSQKALLAALRGHVAEQDELIRATQAVGEHLAAQLRTKLDSPTGDAPTEADRGTTMLGFGPRALSQSPPPPNGLVSG